MSMLSLPLYKQKANCSDSQVCSHVCLCLCVSMWRMEGRKHAIVQEHERAD